MKNHWRRLGLFACLLPNAWVSSLSAPETSSSNAFPAFMADMIALAGPSSTPAGITNAANPDLRIKAGDQVAFMGDSITAFGGYLRLLHYVDAMKQIAAQNKCDLVDLNAFRKQNSAPATPTLGDRKP